VALKIPVSRQYMCGTFKHSLRLPSRECVPHSLQSWGKVKAVRTGGGTPPKSWHSNDRSLSGPLALSENLCFQDDKTDLINTVFPAEIESD